jgi:hypothetical protein
MAGGTRTGFHPTITDNEPWSHGKKPKPLGKRKSKNPLRRRRVLDNADLIIEG